ncbi:MAG: hypothetical protein ABJD02_19580 [Paraglaciecola sp.]|uniref:hypothetical protein n=1 Tax=Paraglaciecola sp. TaxID=1920173 RepID=UPI0032678C4D
MKALQKLAQSAGYTKWQNALPIIEETFDIVGDFTEAATSIGVSPATITMIALQLEESRQSVLAIL